MTTETTQEAGTRYRTKSESVTAIQLTEDNGPAVLAFCGIPEAPGLSATVRALPGPGGTRAPVNLRPGDWIVKRGKAPHEYFSVHGPTAFAMAYEPSRRLADPMFEQAYMDVQKVLDEALGTEEEDGTGGGIASEVWLLAHQRDGARAARDEYRDNAVLHVRERDEARAGLAGAAELIRRMERITTVWTRGMYSARIDCLRGDPAAAAACLSEGLDGYEGPEWDGTETGAGWWERTKAEEGLVSTETTDPAPMCPGGCGCRLGTDDADRSECGCDEGCCGG